MLDFQKGEFPKSRRFVELIDDMYARLMARSGDSEIYFSQHLIIASLSPFSA